MEDQSKIEKIFLQEGGVTITNDRFVVPSQTYAMSGIASAQSIEQTPNRTWPILIATAGLLLRLRGGFDDTQWVATVLMFVGAIWLVLLKNMFQVLLSTSSGEVIALSSEDAAWVKKIVVALNVSIAHRSQPTSPGESS